MFKRKSHVSKSSYWHYVNNNESNLIKLVDLLKNFIEKIFDIKIIKKKNFNNNFETQSYIKSKKIIEFRNKNLSTEIYNFLKKLKISSNKKKISDMIKSHDNFFYNRNQSLNNYGGIGYNNSLLIYVFYKHLNLDLIIESGVWKGYTTLLFDQYSKKINKISFDINFDRLEYKSSKTKYIEYDITNYNFDKNINFNKTLAFFDDHVSQYDRLIFSNELKIKYLIFDDDLNFSAIHSDGWPSLPTISMISDLSKFKKFKWVSVNKEAVVNMNKIKLKNILKNFCYVKSPNITYLTGYYQQTPMAFLIRK